jgi:hypothetical protein
VGAATVAVEETKKLPQTILTYPMTLASQAAHIVMRWQQSLAELVIKGDSTLETLFPSKEEQPEWAMFDEDLDDAGEPGDTEPGPPGTDGERRSAGRFALFSGGEADGEPDGSETNVTTARNTATPTTVSAPDVVSELDYAALTLAQLRARLHSLSVGDLEVLLAYEEASKARAPFQTLLANRITRATAK